MKTKSSVRYNGLKNRIYIVLEGYHDFDEAVRMKNLYLQAIGKSSPGFTVLVDVSKYLPGPEEVQEVHAEAIKAAHKAGLKKVARIIGDLPLGGMQINRIANAEADYSSEHFQNIEEAENYLDAEG